MCVLSCRLPTFLHTPTPTPSFLLSISKSMSMLRLTFKLPQAPQIPLQHKNATKGLSFVRLYLVTRSY